MPKKTKEQMRVFSVDQIAPINSALIQEIEFLRKTLQDVLKQQQDNFAMLDKQAQKIDLHEAAQLCVTVPAKNIANASTHINVTIGMVIDTLQGIEDDVKTIKAAREEFKNKYYVLFDKRAQRAEDKAEQAQEDQEVQDEA